MSGLHEAGQVRLISIKLKPSDSANRVKRKVLKSIRASEKKEHKAMPISHPLELWQDPVHTLPDMPSKDVIKVVSNSRFVVFLLRDGRVCRLPIVSSAPRKKDPGHGEPGDQPNFQVLSDAEYARQLQEDFSTELGPRGGRRRTGERGRGVGASGAPFGGGSSTVLVSLDAEEREPVQVRQMSMRGRRVLGGPEAAPFWSPTPDSPEHYTRIWNQLPSINSNLQSTNQDLEVQSLLTMAAPHRRRALTPPPGYDSLFNRVSSGMEGAEGRRGSAHSSHPVPHYHGDQSTMVGGAGPRSKSDKTTHPWPTMGSLQWALPGKDTHLLFSDVAALHSEVLLVTQQSRQLYSWPCQDADSMTPKPHPLNEELGLSAEAISLLQSSECRASMATVSGKLVTLYDSLLRECPRSLPPSLIQSLSHLATEFPELQGEPVTRLAVSNFLSFATTQSGRVFWWGLTPQAKKDPPSGSSSSTAPSRQQREGKRMGGHGQISDGSLVRLKNGPPCGPNAIVFTMSPTHGPQVGKTVSVMERSSIDPTTSVLVKVFRDFGLRSTAHSKFDATRHDLYESSDIFSGLEVWKLSDVVFLDDSPSVLGRVVAVDRQQVIVDCGYSQTHADLVEGSSTAKSSLKVFKLGELEACIEGPDFYPKVKSSQGASGGQSASTSSDTQAFQRSVSRHVAGVVQHCPVCLLDPAPSKPHQARSFDLSMSGPSLSSSRLIGFRPLAVQANDSGPNLLVERVNDGSAFLVCSAHLTTAALNVTSFVALGYRDSKAKRCTIGEESINCLEGGLVVNQDLVKTANALTKCQMNNSTAFDPTKITRTGGKGVGSKRRTSSRKGKTVSHSAAVKGATRVKGSNTHSPVTFSTTSQTHDQSVTAYYSNGVQSPFLGSCEFIALSGGHPDLFFIRDISGSIRPLLDGLSLKCTASVSSGLASKRVTVPLQSYRCVSSRQYCVEAEGNVAVFVLVPNTKILLPALQNGATDRASTLLATLSAQVQLSYKQNLPKDLICTTPHSGSEPVCQTGKTRLDVSVYSDRLEEDMEGGNGESKEKNSKQTGKTSFNTPESAEVAASDKRLHQTLRKRKNGSASEPKTRKRQRWKVEEEKVKESGGSEEVKVKCPRVALETYGKTEKEEWVGYGREDSSPLLPTRMRAQGDAGEGPEFDVSVLMETTVNNCNILHVCCGGEDGFMTTFDPSLEGTSSDGLGHRRLVILDHILSCKPVRPVITSLICCRNARGHIPFQHALHERNYAAALKLLQFVIECVHGEGLVGGLHEGEGVREEQQDEMETNKNSQDAIQHHLSKDQTHQNLFNKAILAPGQNGLTPLHALIASFYDSNDVKMMRLFVSRLPQNYTAQQLLKLFQKRYPSAYKAEILKQESKDDGDRSVSGSSGEESFVEAEEREGDRSRGNVLFVRNRGRGRSQTLTERSRQRSLFNNTTTTMAMSQTGVVHFSDLSQLRAALKEMHNYRVVTSSSRSTGFGGHMTSVSFLHVHVEEHSCVEEEDLELSTTANLFSQVPDLSDYFFNRGGKEKKEGREVRIDPRLSSSALAHQLFTKLLAYTQVSTAVSSAGDTALATLVHNPRCLSAMETAAKQTPVSATPGSFPQSLLSLSNIILSRDNRHSTSTRRGTGLNPPRGELFYPATSTSSLLNNPPASLPGSHGNKDSFHVQIPTKVLDNGNVSVSSDTSSVPATGTGLDLALKTSSTGTGEDVQKEGANIHGAVDPKHTSESSVVCVNFPSSSNPLPVISQTDDKSTSSLQSADDTETTAISMINAPTSSDSTNSHTRISNTQAPTAITVTTSSQPTASETRTSTTYMTNTATSYVTSTAQPTASGRSDSASTASSGLRLAEYTLENLPENLSSVYTSGSMCGEGLDLFGGLPTPSGGSGLPTLSVPQDLSLPSSIDSHPVTAAGGGGVRGTGPLSPITSALAELRKLQRQLDGDLKRVKEAEQRCELIAAAPAHLRDVAKAIAIGTEGTKPEVLKLMSEVGILPPSSSTTQPDNLPAVPSSTTHSLQLATNVVTTQPSNCGGSDSNPDPRGMEPGLKSARKIPQSLFRQEQSSILGTSSGESSAFLESSGNFLLPLFTNWPCIVTTVLGFYPLTQSSDVSSIPRQAEHNVSLLGSQLESWPSQSKGMSSVHTLDSFTMHLILNCSDTCIKNFTKTIVEKINSCLGESSQHTVDLFDINVHDIDLKSIDESILPILVGKRFLNSVIRVLCMEHSRVKNTFVEMQQLRSRGGGGGEVGGGERGRDQGRNGGRRGTDRERRSGATPLKNIVKIAKSILTQFSWLAIQLLAESAEVAGTPVRLGIAKPMGANSVSAEYSMSGHRPSAASSYRGSTRQPEDPFRSHQRQLHIRSAYHLPNVTPHSTHAHPPTEGIVLRPVVKSDTLHSDGMAGIDSTCTEVEGGGTLQDSSSEDAEGSEHEEDMDLPSSQNTYSATPIPMETNLYLHPLPHPLEGSDRSMYSSSSEDEEYVGFSPSVDLEPGPLHINTTRRREQSSPDNIYPFAWALDGRRIGETSNTAARSDSPTSFLFGGHHEPVLPLFTIPSVRFGAGFLARTFSRFVKDLVDITVTICDSRCTEAKVVLPPPLHSYILQRSLSHLESTWQWVITVLDVAEGQLQRGQNFDAQRHVMSLRSDGPQPSSSTSHNRVHASRSFIGSTPAEYMTYLLRAHTKEDTDCLPVIDLYGYEHVVYVLDALIYTLTHWPKSATVLIDQSTSMTSSQMTSSQKQSTQQTTCTAEELQMECTPTVHNKSETLQTPPKNNERFFRRSESILGGGSTSESEGDPEIKKSNQKFFDPSRSLLESPNLVGSTNVFRGGGQCESSFSRPLSEAYPLAQQPHLLKPYAKKEHLFSSPGRTEGGGDAGGGEGKGEERKVRKGGSILPVSYKSTEGGSLIPSPVTLTLTVDQALQRWHSCISVFAHVFLAEGPGGERDNFLNARAGFASRMARFRQQVSQLYEASISNREWSNAVSNSLSLRIRRDFLLQDSLDHLQQLTKFHYSQIRVKFEGEEGSGPGVNRGFFSALSNELKSSDASKPVLNQVGLLFSEPGKHPEQSGLFAPCPFISRPGTSPSKLTTIRVQRKTYFHAIGRYLGLCFWFRYTIPLMVCRHVAKYLLGRDLAWHDLAFYNADLYEGLRSMLLDAQEGKKTKEEFMATYCCYFEAPLVSGSLEPVLVDLIPGGSKIPVIPERVQEYVRLYATFMMYGCVRDELQAMKEGLNDIIPPELLAGLTAEDFQLLLSGGSANITLSRLKSVIRFNHTHSNSDAICDRFEKMFWRVVSHMTNTQRQELLYFATGSGALPTDTDTTAQTPALLITINVIGSGNTNSLPVASTCSQRMSIPLYPSYLVLKKKLLQAIQCQAYGLG